MHKWIIILILDVNSAWTDHPTTNHPTINSSDKSLIPDLYHILKWANGTEYKFEFNMSLFFNNTVEWYTWNIVKNFFLILFILITY
jgi:hypothetical protein